MSAILKIENVSKQYRLGVVGTGTLSHDLNRWWHTVRGKEDPYLKIGETNDRAVKGDSQYVWALKDISFEVQPGEVLGIIGKNGAGKSTLLKILSQVTGPTTGTIKSRGRIASLLEVGTGFHPELTGKENIYLNGAILGMTKAEIKSKFDEIVEFAGVSRYIDTPVKRYSSGMKVRLAFAVAAHLEPEILVVDEVLAVGDAEFQKKAIGKMQDIAKGEGRTVLFVSHNMAAVKQLCTRGIVLEDGTVGFDGGVEEAVDYYVNQNNTLYTLQTDIREGNGLVRVKNVKTYGKKIGFIPQVGSPFHIEFELENQNKLNDIDIDIRIDDLIGQKMAWLSSILYYKKEVKDLSRIMISFEKLQLNIGLYTVTIYLHRKGEILDWIKNAFTFEVEGGNFYDTGKSVPVNQSKIVYDFKIKYN